MIEYATRTLSRAELLEGLRQFSELISADGMGSAELSLRWDSNLTNEQMCKPQNVSPHDLVAEVLRAESEVRCWSARETSSSRLPTSSFSFVTNQTFTFAATITTRGSAPSFIVQSFSAPRSLRKENEMKIESLGHVVLKVRNQDRAEAFYHGLLGLPIAARWTERKMTFFTLGHHHDFAIAATGDHSPDAPDNSPGLLHVAFRVGQGIDDLRAAKAQLEANGIEVIARDHLVSKSIYFKDPDGNAVELYVDTSDVWKQHPEAVARSDPLDL